MSIRVMASVFQHFPEGGTRKLTLLCLADHANDAGSNCYPSIASIAKRICCSESQARRNVHSLIESGYVSVEPGTEQGGGGSRRYRINIERLTPSTDATPCMNATPSTGASPPLASMRVTPSIHDTRTIRTIKEPLMANGHMDSLFAEFWTAYPRKEKKPRALKAFRRIKPNRECVDAMLAALTRQRASTQWLEASGKFIPHPATWLNDEQWKDAPTLEQQAPKLKVAI